MQRINDDGQTILPPGVKPLHTLHGHTAGINHITWSTDGYLLATASGDHSVRLWDTETWECLHTLKGHKAPILSVAIDPSNRMLASGGRDNTIKIWELTSGRMVTTLSGHTKSIHGVAWSGDGLLLASASLDETIRIWDVTSWSLLQTISSVSGVMLDVAWASDSRRIASASYHGGIWDARTGELIHDLKNSGGLYRVVWSPALLSQWVAGASSSNTLIIWEATTGKQTRVLEGHTDHVRSLSFSGDGRVLASFSSDRTIRLWSCADWREIALIRTIGIENTDCELAFHPHLPLLAAVGSDPSKPTAKAIHIYKLDLTFLLGQHTMPSVSYTSAKVVLVGDSGVGKTGLGWRLAHDEFKEHSSTHGQQFWLLNQLCRQRHDGTQCEAVLWDLAGQPDYRLIHALFLDDADLALILFDPTRDGNPLSGVEFWLKQLRVRHQASGIIPTVLIAGRSDRGMPRLTQEELDTFCKQRGIVAYLPTSAKTGENVGQLVQHMKGLIPWDDKPATVTTETFKRIKNYVLDLKENRRRRKVILTPEELRERLEKKDRKWKFTDDEMLTAVGHLANHGYVTRLCNTAKNLSREAKHPAYTGAAKQSGRILCP